eukprot:619308-Amorphochlora_amoeboformis.AAC.1
MLTSVLTLTLARLMPQLSLTLPCTFRMIYTLTFVALSLPLAHSIQIENPETTITTSVSTDPASTKAVSGAFADGSRPSRSCGRELVILRTSSPSDSFIERYTRLKNEIAGERDLMISFNAHNSSELAMVDKTGIDVVKNLMAKAEDARSRLESAFENDFYAYTDRDMLALFPSLAELPKFVRGRNSLPSYAYYLHDEATMVCVDMNICGFGVSCVCNKIFGEV